MGTWDNPADIPAGHIVTAEELDTWRALLLALLGEVAVYKSVDQSAPLNATTLINDTDLVIPVVANAVYELDMTLFYTAGATGLLKLGWTVPTSATLSWAPDALAASVTSTFTGVINRATYAAGSTPALGAAGTTQIVSARVAGLLRTSSTAGSLQFRFSQNAADNTNATTIKADSYMTVKRVG